MPESVKVLLMAKAKNCAAASIAAKDFNGVSSYEMLSMRAGANLKPRFVQKKGPYAANCVGIGLLRVSRRF